MRAFKITDIPNQKGRAFKCPPFITAEIYCTSYLTIIDAACRAFDLLRPSAGAKDFPGSSPFGHKRPPPQIPVRGWYAGCPFWSRAYHAQQKESVRPMPTIRAAAERSAVNINRWQPDTIKSSRFDAISQRKSDARRRGGRTARLSLISSAKNSFWTQFTLISSMRAIEAVQA